MTPLVWLLVACAALIVLSNLLYGAAMTACHRLRERRWPTRLPLGVPLASLILIGLAWGSSQDGLPAPAYALLVIDTGGPVGWLCAWIWRRTHRPAIERLHQRRPSWVAPLQRG